MLRVGIVGLPNVGKSTLFNALTKQRAEAKNFPFTTIEPNIGVVTVPDSRLTQLAALSKSEKIIPTTIEFVDIAGLVKNAHQGEGLGNQFLSHIREVNAIIHVVRFFNDSNVLHVDNKVDPDSDMATIDTELALADLGTVEKSLPRAKDDAKSTSAQGYGGQGKLALTRFNVWQKLQVHLADGQPARTLIKTDEEKALVKELNLLTLKPVLYLANVSEEQLKSFSLDKGGQGDFLPLSVKIEQELTELNDEEQKTFLAEYGLTDTGLNRLIQKSYKTLNLITFFTTGPKETRAWTVQKGSTAPQAAGQIHSDFERGFIRAETVAAADLIAVGSYAAARTNAKVRDEGKGYIVQDGDIFIFKFSV